MLNENAPARCYLPLQQPLMDAEMFPWFQLFLCLFLTVSTGTVTCIT